MTAKRLVWRAPRRVVRSVAVELLQDRAGGRRGRRRAAPAAAAAPAATAAPAAPAALSRAPPPSRGAEDGPHEDAQRGVEPLEGETDADHATVLWSHTKGGGSGDGGGGGGGGGGGWGGRGKGRGRRAPVNNAPSKSCAEFVYPPHPTNMRRHGAPLERHLRAQQRRQVFKARTIPVQFLGHVPRNPNNRHALL